MKNIKQIVFKLLLQDFFKENPVPKFDGQVLNKIGDKVVSRQKEYDEYMCTRYWLLEKLINISK